MKDGGVETSAEIGRRRKVKKTQRDGRGYLKTIGDREKGRRDEGKIKRNKQLDKQHVYAVLV